jgi:hypothetical protein
MVVKEDAVHSGEAVVRRGEVLALVQRSARRRDYELRRGDRAVGWLRFPPGRRSMAQAEGDQTGSLVLTASQGGVEVRSVDGGGTTVATVERAGRVARLIRTTHGSANSWRRTGRRRWVIGAGEADLLRLTASQGLLKSSVRITANKDLSEPVGMLLCLIGGFLALQEPQADLDGSASVGGVVATAAG